LVVVDDTGNVVTMSPDGEGSRALTDNGGPVRRHFQPTWSPDGSMVAWSELTPERSRVLVSGDDDAGVDSVNMATFPFYLSWSPDGSMLGTLHNGAVGSIDFEIVDVGSLSTRVVDSGAPYYFSWEPGGDGLLVHARGDDLIVIQGGSTDLDDGGTTPNYSAPVWSEAGRVYMTVDGLLLDDGIDPRVLAEAEGFVNLVGNRDGSSLAVQVLNGEGDGLTVALQETAVLTPNAVSVIDLESGDVTIASEELALGMFWSPDGRKLLLLEPTDREGGVEVVVAEGGEQSSLGAITLPTSLVTETLQFFDQYAQSWQMWSPDSSAVVLPGTIDEETGIWVFSAGGEPVRISGGSWAAWSPA
jgi:hypothetical protein